MGKQLKLISESFLPEYTEQADTDWHLIFSELKAKEEFTIDDFEHYLISSSLYSSKIEGNSLDANSFFRNRTSKSAHKRKEVQEIEDLVDAYKLASENKLTKVNFLKAHAILSKTLLPPKERGLLRKVQVGIRDSATMRPVYLAVEPQFLTEEFSKLFEDIAQLLERDLSHKEILYFASMIHIWTAIIHPFGDGNGRAARLLEKWFLFSKLGLPAWSILSEKYYWDNRPEYYENIALGFNYYALHWERCIPFLLMLPKALQQS